VIGDIVMDWNVLTTTMVIWASVVSLALGIDFGPDMYRERKARATIMEGLAKEAEERIQPFTPQFVPHDETMPLFVIQRPDVPMRRKHARV